MAGTVTSQLTNITLAENADGTSWDDIGGGQNSGQSGDFPIQGLESHNRRIDNAIRGFSFDNTTGIDISGTGTHVGFWVRVLQNALINTNGIELLLGTAATPKSGNWEGWYYDETTWPAVGPWIRVWLDPTRAADTNNGSLTSLTAIRQYGCEFDIGDVGGNAQNCGLDRIDYTTGGLLIDGGTVPSPAVFDDFVTADPGNSSNRYGVVQETDGVIFVNARLTIADATATIFNDSGFSVQFASQELAASDFMGVTVDLQNASTDVDFSGGSIKSGGATNLGDFLVTGTSGSFDADGTAFARIRAFEFTSACTLLNCTFAECGAITALSAFDMTDCAINNSTAASSIIWDINVDPDTYLDGIAFASDGSNHALELGTTSPTSVTLNNFTYSGYAGTDGSTGNEAVWVRRTSGTVTINVNGGDTPTIRTDGATVNVVNAKTVTVTVFEGDGTTVVASARVLVEASGAGPLPVDDTVTLTRDGDTVTVAHTAHGIPDGEKVVIRFAAQHQYNGVFVITVVNANSYTYELSQTLFPTVSGRDDRTWGSTNTDSGDNVAASTTWTVPLASNNSGDLLLVRLQSMFTSAGSPGTPSGWTLEGSETTAQGGVWWYSKSSSGSEASVAFTGWSSNAEGIAHSWVIENADQSNIVFSGQSASNQTTDPDPPNLNDTGGATTALWIGAHGAQNNDHGGNLSAPTNYTNLTHRRVSNGSIPLCSGTAERLLDSEDEDPGVFDWTTNPSGSNSVFEDTVKVYPASTPPASPATIAAGKTAIKATGAVLVGTTNGSGVLTRSDFPFSSNQPVSGVSRKSSASPYLSDGVITGTITTDGLVTTAVMGDDGSD